MDTTIVSSKGKSEADLLADFVRKHRFEHNEALPKVIKEYRQIRGKSPCGSCLVLVHAPFPAEDGKRDRPSGQACGKSDLLLRVREELEQDEGCYVIPFAGVRKRQETWTFFDELVNRLLDKENKPVRWARFTRLLHSVGRRISIFCSYAPWPLATIASLTLIINTLKYWLDPHNKGIVGPIAIWFQHNDALVAAVSAAAVVIWFAYTYGLILRDAKAAGWKDSWQIPTTKAIRDEQLSVLRKEPERLFQPFIDSKRTLVLLLDDVDFLDAQNFQAFFEFYEQAVGQKGMSIFAVLAYNPRNPRLRMAENSGIRNRLEDPEVLCHAIALEPLTRADLKAFLWGYYNDQLAETAATVIYQSFQEAESNPGLILSYFEKNDESRRYGDRKIPDLSTDEIRADFQRFLMHDQRIATDLVAAIKQHENGEECLTFLKYLLAFKSDRVSNEQFRTVTGISAESFKQSVRLLETGQIGILKLTTTDRPGVLEFREPYLRTLLETNWREWEPGFYYTEVINALNQKTKEKDKPEIALGANASPLAIDVLWREGEYYYNYFGKSDAGYALRYYGLAGGAALQKWLTLCESAQDEELWGLIRWKSAARNNPYANTTRKQYPVYSFAPDLVLTTARLYWMSGDSSTAERILVQEWPSVKKRLPPTEDRELANKLKTANTQMQMALAEMRFRRGATDDWETAAGVAAEVRRHERPAPDSDRISFDKATALAALITHYREIGSRNLVWPERFVRTRDDLNKLRQASEEIPEQRLDRLGILQTLTDSSWEILYPWRTGPPLNLKIDALPAMNFEEGVVEEFERALGEQMNNLRAWAKQRQKSKEKARPGARVDEADLLFHEGIFLFQRARHYCLRTYLDLKPDEDLLKSKTMRKAQERHDCYLGTAHRMSQFCAGSLLTDMAPEAVGVELQEIEQLHENQLTVDRGRRAVAALERMFREGWESIIKQADAKLRMAETIYRRLGSMPGLSAVAFAKALLSLEFPAKDASRVDWVENTERFLYRSKGQLGWQLDALRAHLLLALWSETIDVPRATAEYEAAEQWTRPERLGLPQALGAEINLKIAELSAMPQFPLRTSEELIDRLRLSQEAYERIKADAPYISPEDMRARLLSIHWWLAELHKRVGQTDDGPTAEWNQQQAIEHCTQVLTLAKGHREAGYWEGITRLPLAWTLSAQGRSREALEQLDLARQYFARDGKNDTQLLQTLVAMVKIVRSYTSEEPDEERMKERFVDLFTIASRQLDEVSRIDASAKFILQTACKLIGDVLRNNEATAPEEQLNPLFWYSKCFELSMNLGLPAQAILLDEDIRPLYMRTSDGLGLVTHNARLFQAARRLDARREKIPRSVSRILKESAELKPEKQSEQAGTKREYRQSAAAEEEQQTIDSTIQSRDFYTLFEHYRRTGGDRVWALEMAVNVEVPNQYSREAAKKKEHIGEELDDVALTLTMGGRTS